LCASADVDAEQMLMVPMTIIPILSKICDLPILRQKLTGLQMPRMALESTSGTFHRKTLSCSARYD
jgi:hypothetical protein